MKGKVFLVIGPESSGNHLASKVLKTMDAYWEEPQKLDSFLKGDCGLDEITDNPHIVLRRSVPHGHEWFNPAISAVEKFGNEGYRMYTIILQRESVATILSNYYHRSSTIEEAWGTLIKAEKHIANLLSNNYLNPHWTLNTSALMKDPKPVIRGLEFFTGLRWPHNVSYESVVHDSDIGRHNLFLEHGFESIDRMLHKPFIKRPAPLVRR